MEDYGLIVHCQKILFRLAVKTNRYLHPAHLALTPSDAAFTTTHPERGAESYPTELQHVPSLRAVSQTPPARRNFLHAQISCTHNAHTKYAILKDPTAE